MNKLILKLHNYSDKKLVIILEPEGEQYEIIQNEFIEFIGGQNDQYDIIYVGDGTISLYPTGKSSFYPIDIMINGHSRIGGWHSMMDEYNSYYK